MEQYLTEAEQLYKDHRYEEALAAYERAIRLSMPDPDPRLYYGRAAVLEQLAQQAYNMAKQRGYSEDTSTEVTPRTMSLSVLTDRCMSEINNYRRGEASSDQYCLEIFRRAMQERDNAAWNLLEDRFKEFLLASFRRHPMSEAASRLDSPENYVALAFARFWIAAVQNQQVTFSSLGAALSYLRSCLHSTILDMLRSYSRSTGQALPDSKHVEESLVEDYPRELWEIIEDMLPNEREKRLAYLLYHINLKPREVISLYPDEFESVQVIYRLRRNIMERLLSATDRLRRKLDITSLHSSENAV